MFPHDFEISVYGSPPDTYVKSICIGDQEVKVRKLDWRDGVPAGPMLITLSKGAQLFGIVEHKEGKPLPGAKVALVPEDEARRRQTASYKIASSDQAGVFRLRGIPPGEYRAFAWENVQYGVYEDPEIFKTIESAGVKLKLGEGEAQTIRLEVLPAPPEI